MLQFVDSILVCGHVCRDHGLPCDRTVEFVVEAGHEECTQLPHQGHVTPKPQSTWVGVKVGVALARKSSSISPPASIHMEHLSKTDEGALKSCANSGIDSKE